MRQDLLEDFEDIKDRGASANREKLRVLITRFECEIAVKASIADQLKSYSQRLNNETKELCVFRDILMKQLEGLKE